MPRNLDLNRRQWLRSAAATAAAATLLDSPRTAEAQPQPQPPEGLVDAHSHVWTPDVRAFPLAGGQTAEDLRPHSFTDDELLAVAQPLGVRRVVLIQHHIYHGWDNAYLLHCAARRPGTFAVVAMIDDRAEGTAAGDRLRALLEKAVTGIRITPWIRGEDWLEGPGMESLWKTAAETGQNICCLIDPKNLPQVDAMCARFPDTPVVVDHFARIGVDGRVRDEDVAALAALAKHPRTRVKLSAFYALGSKRPPYEDLVPMIRKTLDAFGPERCMWGSDSPYQIDPDNGNTYAASLELIQNRLDFLAPADRQRLLRTTAENTFFPR